MNLIKKITVLLSILLLLSSAFATIVPKYATNAQSPGDAELSGNVYDKGRDVDNDTSYDFLDIAFEINVSVYGYYRIELQYLRDSYNYIHSVWAYDSQFLDVGAQWLNLSVYGPRIFAEGYDVAGVAEVRLYDNNYGALLDYLSYASLSRIYYYTEFDCRAVLTGRTFDAGVDTDGDGLFNKLQVDVELNVTDPASYQVEISINSGWPSYIYVSNYSSPFLYPGVQTVNLTLDGVKLYASNISISSIGLISLSVYEGYYSYSLQRVYYHPLNHTYNHNEFDPFAFFTGRVWDEGVDIDSDGLFDELKISVEINVTDLGYYSIRFQDLVDGNYTHLSDWQSYDVELASGLHIANFTVYGPRIYGTRFNPVRIGELSISVTSGYESVTLETRQMVPLPVVYQYDRFESLAFLTGQADDWGEDRDGDHLFDDLIVGVEVNVTEAGSYVVTTTGLSEAIGNGSRPVYYYESQRLAADQGIHVVNFTFPGPMIAYNSINPTHITGLSLWEDGGSYELSSLSSIALTTQHNYTEFNTPMNDMRVQFTVYPNATVVIGGSSNYSRIYPYPYYDQPSVNATLDFSSEGNFTHGSVNGTARAFNYYDSPWPRQLWPYNSTSLDLVSEYQNGMLTAQLETTVNMPPQARSMYPFNLSDFSFNSDYSDGMLNVNFHGETRIPPLIASQYPFNVSDATVLADFTSSGISGNITLHAVSGFPLGDVIVHFSGNRTELSLTGYANVIYGNYFGTAINETVLEDLLTQLNSTIPGRGEGSLYEMSEGNIECTAMNLTKTPIAVPSGGRVDFDVTIEGNFTNFLASQLTHIYFGYYASNETHQMTYASLDAALSSVDHGSLTANYLTGSGIGFIDLSLSCNVKTFWGKAQELIPPIYPPEYRSQVEVWLNIANASAYALQSASIAATYSSSLQKLDFSASLSANVTQLKDRIIPLLPEIAPSPPIRDLIGSCTNTTYCKLNSFNSSIHYLNGAADFNASWILEGDLTEELNLLKRSYVTYLNQTSPYMMDWQMRMINSTEVDIGNLKAQIRQSREARFISFEQLKLNPSKDAIDFIRFKLARLLNITNSYYEPPRQCERVTIAFNAGFNGTHTVLFYAPNTIPRPDTTGNDYRSIAWQNVSLSKLNDLLFKIAYLEEVDYASRTFYVPIFTNSTVSEFSFDAGAKCLRFNVTGAEGSGFFNITIPRELLYAMPSQWMLRLDGVQISSGAFNVTENSDYVFIYLPYSHSEHEIEIQGTSIVTEFPPNILPIALAALSLLAVAVAIKQRRRLSTLAAKSQRTIRAFAARMLHPNA